MPIKMYQCEKCGHVFEKFIQSVKKTLKAECPRCSSEEIKPTFLGQLFGNLGCSQSG